MVFFSPGFFPRLFLFLAYEAADTGSDDLPDVWRNFLWAEYGSPRRLRLDEFSLAAFNTGCATTRCREMLTASFGVFTDDEVEEAKIQETPKEEENSQANTMDEEEIPQANTMDRCD